MPGAECEACVGGQSVLYGKSGETLPIVSTHTRIKTGKPQISTPISDDVCDEPKT